MKFNLLLFGIISFSQLFSQVTYTISPSNTINLSVDFNQTTDSKIYQVNTDNSKIVLKWERVLVNLPVGWIYSSCDYGACYGTIPIGPTTMDSIPVGGQGMVGLDIEPGSILGTGVVKVLVYQDGYRSIADTLTWYITSQAVGIKEITGNDGISIYPNPTANFIHIDFKNNKVISCAYLIDTLGKIVKLIEISEMNNIIDISGLNNGYYNLVLETKDEKLLKRIIKSN